ncbi:hypothetical protein B6U66_00740 [Candidatus Bathyarchaeota archaeon ex4484_135]|nr:MAG: hypothetical protein B6U66_00740 [Candidatus Bathyarchaeota archaeon ex4484_135]
MAGLGESIDIFGLMVEEEEKRKKALREEVLGALGVPDFFKGGSIWIDARKCYGRECDMCVKACPTKAIFWRGGQLVVQEEICLFCTACVANCMVEGCIRVRRTRPDGTVEEFSSLREVATLLRSISGRKALEAVEKIFPSLGDFLSRFGPLRS